jgi:formate-dependent nitrite reductase membrane component NrfD
MNTNSDKRVLYPQTSDPVTTDGRDIDTSIAVLEGEAAQQQSHESDRHLATIAPAPWNRIPRSESADTTYYDRPMLKQSVWSIDIPIYYFLGGTAGAALTLGAAVQLGVACGGPRGRHPLRRVSAICHWAGIIGSTAGGAFLIHDLGRPSRFLNMMRVFRPTSPMNMGTWILCGAVPSAITTGLLANRRGFLGAIGDAAGYISGIFGAALAGYTGVLVSNTAIPIWQQGRRWVPVMFLGSSASAAASVIDLIAKDEPSRRLTRIFGTAGRLVEIAAAKEVEHAASDIPKVAEPFHHGRSALLWKTATALTALSLATGLLPGRRSKVRIVTAVAGILGSLSLRFAVHYLGNASARDARASFQQQRHQEAEGPRAVGSSGRIPSR